MSMSTIHVGACEGCGDAGQAGRQLLRDLVSRLSVAVVRHTTRTSLRDLDGDQLRDIGVTRAQALAEADKPFWR